MANSITSSFQILGLDPGASPQDVKQAYYDLVKVWHPDRFEHDSRLKIKASVKLTEINLAYKAICSHQSSPQAEFQPEESAGSKSKPKSTQPEGAIRNIEYLRATKSYVSHRSIFEVFELASEPDFPGMTQKIGSDALAQLFERRFVTLHRKDDVIAPQRQFARGVANIVNRVITVSNSAGGGPTPAILLSVIYIRDVLTLSGFAADLRNPCVSALRSYGWRGQQAFLDEDYLSSEKKLAREVGLLLYQATNASGKEAFLIWGSQVRNAWSLKKNKTAASVATTLSTRLLYDIGFGERLEWTGSFQFNDDPRFDSSNVCR